MKKNKINREEYHEQHLLIHKDLHNEFKEVISKYNSYGNTNRKNTSFDVTNMSEVIRMLIHRLVKDYNDNPNAHFDMMKKLSDFRDAGAKP